MNQQRNLAPKSWSWRTGFGLLSLGLLNGSVLAWGNAAIAQTPQTSLKIAQADPVKVVEWKEMECPPAFAPDMSRPFDPDWGYNLTCWDLVRQDFICVNNPKEVCGNNVEIINLATHRSPMRRYDMVDDLRVEGHFSCLNNVNPDCFNPVHYGVLFGSEYTSDLSERTDPLWAQLGTSRPSVAPAPTPLPVAPPPATPIPGLW